MFIRAVPKFRQATAMYPVRSRTAKVALLKMPKSPPLLSLLSPYIS